MTKSEMDLVLELRKSSAKIDPEFRSIVDGFDYLAFTPQDISLVVPEGSSGRDETFEKRLNHAVLLEQVVGLSPAAAEKASHDAFAAPAAPKPNLDHKPALKKIIDIARRHPKLAKISCSQGWGKLLDSFTSYVGQQVAEAGA
jgi:hypothetical protein